MTENSRSEKGKGKMMQTIMKNWKIEAGTVEQIYGTAWNVDHKYILKKYDDQIKLDQSVLIMETLKEQNVPVAGIIKTADGKKYSEIDSQFYLLTWAGQNKASWKQPTVAASAPVDSDGKVWRLYVDPNTHELLIVKENP